MQDKQDGYDRKRNKNMIEVKREHKSQGEIKKKKKCKKGTTIRNDIKCDDFCLKSGFRSQFKVRGREKQSREMIGIK